MSTIVERLREEHAAWQAVADQPDVLYPEYLTIFGEIADEIERLESENRHLQIKNLQWQDSIAGQRAYIGATDKYHVEERDRLRSALKEILNMSVECGADAGHPGIERVARAALERKP